MGGDVNDAYADTEFGGITDGNVLIGIEVIGKVCGDCGMIVFTAEFLGVVFPLRGDCNLCEDIAPKGDVDGFVEVVDPDDFKGGEQLFID